MDSSQLGQDLGRLFEVGFNIGMLTYIKQKELKCNYGNLYEQDLEQINFPKIKRKLIDKIGVISDQHREIVNQWAKFFLQKSFLAGLNFLDEYFSAIGWDSKRQLRRIEVVYFQAYFADDNTLGTYLKGENRVYQDWLSQFNNSGIDINKFNTNKYKEKGEFLKADSLVYFRYKHQVRILVIDYSIFTIKSIRDLTDLNNIEVLRQILLSNISYLKSKSVFANLGLDSKNDHFLFSESLSQYYKAFVCKDKETIKAIQAGSYAYSFWNWLTSQQQISPEDEVTFNIIGYSDRDSATLSVQQHNIKLLETCYHIYREQSVASEISSARKQVLNIIRRKAKRSFAAGGKFIDDILGISRDGIHLVSHQETFSDFNSYLDTISPAIANQLDISSSLNLQQAHGILIKQILSSTDDSLFAFLTGNPGIGKTTAISNFLKQEEIIEAGFLFIYISPRIQVNLDIVQKFTDSETNCLCDDRLITVNTNSTLISKNEGKATVQYCSNQLEDRFTLQTVDFIPQNELIEFSSSNSQSVERKTATRLQESSSNKKGVLYSMSEAIYSLINDGHNNIIATVALQSLKKLSGGKDTLDHFQRIFRDVYNETDKKPIEAKLEQLSQRVKHIFIAIDEITGDRSGVDFLLGISNKLKKYGLTNRQYFNTKIIVADASIMDTDVIEQHLSKTTAEPNKIFFRKAPQSNASLTKESFTFNSATAVALNTNSYPAKQLHITYKVLIHSLKFKEKNQKIDKPKNYDLEQRAQSEIINDIERILSDFPNEQIIVYIQDKARLSNLINTLKERRPRFELHKDYLEIHADLGQSEKQQQVQKHKNTVQIIFMTASASRGLSFPQTKHILVDLPRFEIEANLMEVIQVIYRGRGNHQIDAADKQLIFYLTEQAIYYIEDADDRRYAIQESTLNILDFLIILHISIRTRIYGYGNISDKNYMMIPVGGKSVLTAGESLSNKIKNLIRDLKKEHRKRNHNLRLKQAYKQLEELMKTAEITIHDNSQKAANKKLSYLKLLDDIRQEFIKPIDSNLSTLLYFPAIQTGYVAGSLLIVSLANQKVEEVYRLKIDDKTVTLAEILSELAQDALLSEKIQMLINETLQLIRELEQQRYRNQRLEQENKYLDRYYAIPLFVFLVNDTFLTYFRNREVEPEDQRFRRILEVYVRSIFPISQVIPIGYKYEKIPFLIFRSYSLKEMRDKQFSDNYLMNSKELNILNLILAQSDHN